MIDMWICSWVGNGKAQEEDCRYQLENCPVWSTGVRTLSPVHFHCEFFYLGQAHRSRSKAYRASRAVSSQEQRHQDDRYAFPVVCWLAQCSICIGDERKSYEERTFGFSKFNKLWNHVNRAHLQIRSADAPDPCHHPVCLAQGVILETLMAVKNYTEQVHHIRLRG